MAANWGFIGPTYTSRSIAVEGERCLNLFPERIESGKGKSGGDWALYGTPGLSLFTTLGTSPGRGLFANDFRLFAVAGNTYYEIFQDGSTHNRGTLAGGTTPVTFFPNGNQVFLVTGQQGYLDTGTALLGPADGIPAAQSGAFLDGYFLAVQPQSNRFQVSDLNNGKNWDPANFGVKEGYPDHIITSLATGKYIYLFGSQTMEVWYDAGNPTGSVFSPYPGVLFEIGCAALWSPAADNEGGLFWLGQDSRGPGIVWRAQGLGAPQRVSNHAVEFAIQEYARTSTIADAVGYCYQEGGHAFYVLSFPTADSTWVFDARSGQWHERCYWDPVRSVPKAILGRYHAYAFGKHFVQDPRNGKVYEQSMDLYDDAGDPIRRMRTCPHISNEMKWNFFTELQIDMQVGNVSALVDGNGNPRMPQVMISMSNDGGFTFGTEYMVGAGFVGQYLYRVKKRRLGRARDRVFKVVISDPIPVALVDAYLAVVPGDGS